MSFVGARLWMKMSGKDWVISMVKLQKIYFKYPDNQIKLTSIEYINNVSKDIPHLLILTRIQMSANWCSNRLDDKITETKS